uniref:MADF domain-containing protein n=1 Tax=Knipowitschia caucasica TaxID=637954 RepID=A0AAV2JD38_KNICA
MWRNLQDTYVRNKRDGQGRSGQAAIKKKKWKYMDVMAFLQSSTTKRRSDSNIEMEEEEEEEIEGEVSTEIVRASDEEGVPEMENSSGSASSSSSGAKRKKRVDSEDSIGSCRVVFLTAALMLLLEGLVQCSVAQVSAVGVGR